MPYHGAMRTRGGPLVLVLLWALAACGSDGGEAPDAGPPDAFDPGPIQCRTTEECTSTTGDGCFASRAGGVCANCADPGDTCPTGTTCITGGTSGATECAFSCVTDDDCNIGMYCVTEGPIAGYCQPRICGDGLPACPYPYTFCRQTTDTLWECARPMCADGMCPAPLVCPAEGAFCMEP